METIQREIRRHSFRAAAALLLSSLAMVATAIPAHAGGWATSDTLDTPSLWRSQMVGSGVYHFHTTGGSTLMTPAGGSFVHIGMNGGTGWSAAARNLRLSPAATHTTVQCAAQVALRGVGSANIEVIDPTTWNYIAVQKVNVTPGWAKYSVGPWAATKADVVFRVAALKPAPTSAADISVDDLKVACTYSYE